MQSVVPFVNGRCYFKETLEIFDRLLKVFRLKREKNATEGRARTLTDLFFLMQDVSFCRHSRFFPPEIRLQNISSEITHAPPPPQKSNGRPLKAWLQMVASTIKNGKDRLQKEIGNAHILPSGRNL